MLQFAGIDKILLVYLQWDIFKSNHLVKTSPTSRNCTLTIKEINTVNMKIKPWKFQIASCSVKILSSQKKVPQFSTNDSLLKLPNTINVSSVTETPSYFNPIRFIMKTTKQTCILTLKAFDACKSIEIGLGKLWPNGSIWKLLCLKDKAYLSGPTLLSLVLLFKAYWSFMQHWFQVTTTDDLTSSTDLNSLNSDVIFF